MKTMCYFILATGSLISADGAGKGDPSKGDLDKLRGTWLTVSLVNDGKTLVDEKSPPKIGPATKLLYDGNTWMIKLGDKTVASGSFKIDATKMPREIDIMDESGVKNDKTKLGIYELQTVTPTKYASGRQPAIPGRRSLVANGREWGTPVGVSSRENHSAIPPIPAIQRGQEPIATFGS